MLTKMESVANLLLHFEPKNSLVINKFFVHTHMQSK